MKPIKYSITVPGSKSLMNRALLCAALAHGKSTIMNPVYCEDTNYMIKALRGLGIKIETHPTYLIIHGSLQCLQNTQRVQRSYIGNAGTVKRFLTPFLPLGSLVGNKRMSQRPIQDLEQAVTALRVKNKVNITGTVSSQFISSLLMYAPTLGKKVSIQVTGKLVSAPYVQMTIQVMKQFGITVTKTKSGFVIQPQQYRPSDYVVEGDASSATYWWALAAITGSHITVPNIPLDTLQPDAKFKQLLRQMGCQVIGNTVVGPWNHELKAVRVNMSDYPDAVLSAAIVMVCANGKSHISGIDHLAYKETDRLALLRKNLNKLSTKKPIIETGDDHRFAMAFTILGVPVDNKSCVKKSYPSFWSDWKKVQQQAKRQTIVLTGMRGVGKTTYGKYLAKKYQMKFIDTDDYLVFRNDWKKFRDQEHQVIKKLHKKTSAAIATGGGTLMYSRNIKLLKRHYIILMTAPLPTLRQRLAKQSHRPTLKKNSTVTSELVEVWNERRKKYYAVADNVYDRR